MAGYLGGCLVVTSVATAVACYESLRGYTQALAKVYLGVGKTVAR